jgi:predicted alpha-1,2-mannosidase
MAFYGFLSRLPAAGRLAMLVGAVAALAAMLGAQVSGDVLGLARLKNAEAFRASSNNPDPRNNDDSLRPIPGETVALADLTGPGVITHIWVTIAANEYGWPRLLRLRIYYDGSPTPSVDAPVGDFFAVGHGVERPINSLMVRDSSSGRARNCYWPMPFRKSCKVTVTNEGRHRVSNLYYHVDWSKLPSLADDVAYFHAHYKQELPAAMGRRYEILNVRGRGHYVGTVFNVIQNQPGWFGEGDDYFYVDGKTKPNIEGTGTEDYFNDAWSLRVAEGPYTGVPVAEGTGPGARMSAYRWHIVDPIPFQKSLRFAMEHAGWTFNANGSVRSAFEERADLFSSTAFWYQKGIAEGLPPLPYGPARLPHGNARQIEAESRIAGVKTERGKAEVQKEVFWSRDLLFFAAEGAGARLDVPFDVAEDGLYEVLAQLAHSPDYGIYRVLLDGKAFGTGELEHEPGANIGDESSIDTYHTELYVAEDHPLGWRRLARGPHTLTFVCAGKNMQSKGFNLGIDTIVLAKVATPIVPGGAAAERIRRYGEEGLAEGAAEALAALRSPDPAVREAAAWAFTQAKTAAAQRVAELTAALADPDPVVRGLAAVALRDAGPRASSALPKLIAELKDSDENVRLMTAQAIAAQGGAAVSAVPALIEACGVRGEHVHVQRSLAVALGAIGPAAKPALPVLEELAKIPRVETYAVAAMESIRGPLAAQNPSPVDEVNPLIDTHKSRWFFFSSACRPFGMVNLSPDTQTNGDWNAGYMYEDKSIRAFSHLHGWQLAALPVMPVVGKMNGNEGFEAYKSTFSHQNEAVKAGYHKVVLDDYGITVELTSTRRAGFHRYSFPATPQAYVLFDTGAPLGPGSMQDAEVRRVNDRELAGYATMAPTPRRKKPLTVYFVAAFDRAFDEFGGWERAAGAKTGEVLKQPVSRARGAGSGGYVHFAFAQPGRVLLKVAISYVSEEQARLNLAAELPHWDFDRVVKESSAEWNEWLSKVEVEGGTHQQRVKFYTDLWHALLGRRTFSDANGRYIDNTGPEPRVRQVPLDKSGQPVRATYNSDAFWGSQWTLNILWSMAYPQVMNDMAASLIDYYTNGGMIARGPSGGNYTFVMIGDQATPLIAAAYNKGIRNFDVAAAYEGCRKNAFPGGIRDHAGYETGPDAQGGGMKYYVERGYVPLNAGGSGMHREPAAQTLEYAYQDWCLAQFAKALGKEEDYQLFLKRSGNWRNVFDASVGWMRPRNLDGSWYADFTPICKGSNCRGFVESNSAIYTYHVMQDLPGLIAALGGREKFIEKLNHQFELAAPAHFITPHGQHGENWVDYENQPSCHMAHLFSHAGAPWLTQYWVRRVKDETFGDITPEGGYNGDEDQGQMGALSALMAMGLFDVQGGAELEPRYEITSPVFDRVTIHLDPRYFRGKTFVITARNNQPGHVYIQAAKLNGRPLEGRFWITHKELTAGGTLEIMLGPQPNKSWGVVR